MLRQERRKIVLVCQWKCLCALEKGKYRQKFQRYWGEGVIWIKLRKHRTSRYGVACSTISRTMNSLNERTHIRDYKVHLGISHYHPQTQFDFIPSARLYTISSSFPPPFAPYLLFLTKIKNRIFKIQHIFVSANNNFNFP